MNVRAGAATDFIRNQVVAGRTTATTGRPDDAAAARASIPALDGVARWSADSALDLGGQLRALGWGELVGVEPGSHPVGLGREQDPPALVGAEHATLAEHIGEAGPALGGDPRQLLVDEMADVGLGRIPPLAELGRDGVGTEPGRQDVDRSLVAELVGHLEEPELGPQVEAVAGLGLDRRDPVSEHLVEPATTVGEQVVGGGRPGRRDRRQDPAAGGQDLEIAGAPLAQLELALTRSGEQQVGVRIDQPGRDQPAGRVDPGEPRQRQPGCLEARLDLAPRTDGRDPIAPGRDHRRIGRVRSADVGGVERGGLGLAVATPDAPGQGRHGARAEGSAARSTSSRCGRPR